VTIPKNKRQLPHFSEFSMGKYPVSYIACSPGTERLWLVRRKKKLIAEYHLGKTVHRMFRTKS